MIHVKLSIFPRGRRAWRRALFLWGGFVLAMVLGTGYMMSMPGRSFSGPLPALSVEEDLLSARLERHVRMLAEEIGERNLARYDSLKASVCYLERVFREVGDSVAAQEFVVDGKKVNNIEVELRGESRPEEIVIIGAHYDSVFGCPGANDNMPRGRQLCLRLNTGLLNQAIDQSCSSPLASLLSSFLLGNETWENPGDLRYRLRPRSKPSRHLTWFSRVAQPCCWSVIAFFMMGTSIGSVQLELGDLGLNAEEMSTLSRHGVVRPRQLLRKSRDPEWRRQLRVELHWVEVRMQDVRNQAELYCFKGIGRSFGTLLEKNGVRQVKDLIGMKPEALHQRLRKTAEVDGAWAPRVDMVRVWVLAAEDPGIVMRRE